MYLVCLSFLWWKVFFREQEKIFSIYSGPRQRVLSVQYSLAQISLPICTRSRLAISPKLDLDISLTSSVEKFFSILFSLNFDSEFKVSGRIGWALAPFCVDSASFSSVWKEENFKLANLFYITLNIVDKGCKVL